MCMPGDNIKMTVELHTPIAMEENLRFAIREGRQDRRLRRRDQDPPVSEATVECGGEPSVAPSRWARGRPQVCTVSSRDGRRGRGGVR